MITAVDSSVLFDILTGDARHGPTSEAALLRVQEEMGGVVACDVVWAETASWFESPSEQVTAFGDIGIRFATLDASSAHAAGRSWRRYRTAGGKRSRLVGDFLIGAHAARQADGLLTRDRGFYRTFFEDLVVIDPEEPQ